LRDQSRHGVGSRAQFSVLRTLVFMDLRTCFNLRV
jgi:hypothetical protein